LFLFSCFQFSLYGVTREISDAMCEGKNKMIERLKKIILAIMFLLIFTSFLSLYAQWARTYGGIYSDWPNSIQQTNDGGYIVAGGTRSFGNEGDDFWILKFTSDGGIEWQKTYGGSVNDEAHSIQQTNDGGYIVVGETSSFGTEGEDIWVLKLTSDGEIEWQKTYGGSESGTDPSIQQTNDGGYIVAGEIEFGAVVYDFWILKLSSAGDVEWQKTYGGDKSDSASFIQQRDDGGYIVVGHTESFGAGWDDIWILMISPAGNIERQKTYGGSKNEEANSFQQTNDGGYIIAGITGSFGAGDADFWILKLSSDGDIEWQKTYGESEREWASSIQQTIDGGYIVAGWTNSTGAGGDGIWILKLFPNGDIEWQKTYEGSDSYSASSIKQTIDGGYIVGGSAYFGGGYPPCDDSNSLILKLSSTGDIEWQNTYGGNYSDVDVASFIQQTSDEGYIVAGQTNSWSAWGKIWILKLLPNGDINPRCAFIKRSNAEVLDTDIMPEETDVTPEDTDITPQDTDITPQDTDITSQNSNANVCNLCSEICTLTLSDSSGGTTDPAPGNYTYATGAKVTLKAVPDGDCSFNRWSINIDCEINPITITMDGDKSIEALFYTPGSGEGIMESFGYCFIATAAYGSPLHPYVRILRDFRNTYLVPSKLGRKIVDIYYRYSPFVANIIAKHKALKVMVRISLLPIIAISYSTLHLGPTITTAVLVFIFMIPVFLILRYQRKLRRQIRRKKISN
jgi:hypothetical protein